MVDPELIVTDAHNEAAVAELREHIIETAIDAPVGHGEVFFAKRLIP